MSTKTLGYLILAVGILIVIAMFAAGPLQLFGASAGFGTKKIAGLVVGIILLAGGGYLSFIRKPAA